jgi:hypothetical protein
MQVIVTGEATRTYFELRGQQLQLRRAPQRREPAVHAELAQARSTPAAHEFDTACAQAQLSR